MTFKIIENPYLIPQFKNKPLMSFYHPNQYVKFVAIDIGYHGVKIITEEGVSFIPNVVCKKKGVQTFTGSNPRRIVYNSGKQEFFVGEIALDQADEGDIRSNDRYSMDFIKTPEFLAIFRSAIYIATKGNPKPYVVTGLPSLAFEENSPYVDQLYKILVGKHEFQIALGNQVKKNIKYEQVSFVVEEDNLLVFPQPLGTLASQAMSIQEGQLQEVNTVLLNQNDQGITRTIIDGGFYTVDVHTMKRGATVDKFCLSLEGNGMYEPYQIISDKIRDLTKTDDFKGTIIPVWQLSQHLEGKDKILIDAGSEDPLDVSSEVDRIYSQYGQKIGRIIFEEKLNRAVNIQEIYLTGGTSTVFYEEFKKIFMPNNKLKIAKCVLNGMEIESRYYNAIGYFYLMLLEFQDVFTKFSEDSDSNVESELQLQEG